MGGIKSFCSFEHLIEFTRSKPAKEIARKAVKRDTKAKLDSLKTASDYIKEAQVAFNAYIRVRDKNKQCISCGCLPGWQAGRKPEPGALRRVNGAFGL